MNQAPAWFCCHQLVERTVIAVVAPVLVVTPGFLFPEALFEPLWLSVSRSRQARKAAFLEVFGIDIVTIGESPERFLTPRSGFLSFWLEAAVFTSLPSQGCPSGCVRFDLI